VRDRGYSGLSFREQVKDVGIQERQHPPLFPDQGSAGRRAGESLYIGPRRIPGWLAGRRADPRAYLARYTDVFRDTLRSDNRTCLEGILAAEHKELPDEVRNEVVP
jgi:TetR/AcrR family transcriptional repressor of nem operon